MDYLLSEEQKMIQDLARKIAKEKIQPVAAKYDQSEEEGYEEEASGAEDLSSPTRRSQRCTATGEEDTGHSIQDPSRRPLRSGPW